MRMHPQEKPSNMPRKSYQRNFKLGLAILIIVISLSAITYAIVALWIPSLAFVLNTTFLFFSMIIALITIISLYNKKNQSVTSHDTKDLDASTHSSVPLLEVRQSVQQQAMQDSSMSKFPQKPSSLFYVPYQRNAFFTGREDVLKAIHRIFVAEKTNTQASRCPQAISGLGGIGKTVLALEYVYRYRNEYDNILWIRAESQQTLISDLTAIADLLQLHVKDEEAQKFVVDTVSRWLEDHTNWLIILDNVEDLAILESFLPLTRKGHFLLTTRIQFTIGIVQGIPIIEMGEEEGALLLLRRASLIKSSELLEAAQVADRNIALEISTLMAGLPLALDQAGAYIEECRCSLSDFLNLYHTRIGLLLKQRRGLINNVSGSSQRGTSLVVHPESVATTWSLSFEKIKQANLVSAELLTLCAFLHPDAIPEEILTKGAPALSPALRLVAEDPHKLNDAIAELRKYSLINRDPNTKTLTIHRLVQEVIKEDMSEEMKQQWAEYTVKAVNKAFPKVDPTTWAACQRCLTHAQACATLIEQRKMTFPEAASLLDRTGQYLQGLAQYPQAEQFYQQALKVEACGHAPVSSDYPNSASIYNNLGLLSYDQGHYSQAEQLIKRALEIGKQVPENEHVATSLNLLGWLYFNQNKYEQAEYFYQQALGIRQHIWGKIHPDIAESINTLALLYRSQAKYILAEEYFGQAIEMREKTLGAKSPYLAISLNDLAWLYRSLGKYDLALSLYERTLDIRREVLGDEHPSTATSNEDLATLYVDQGKYTQAEALYLKVWAIRERIFGQEHHRVAITLNNLASLYFAQGKFAEAERLFKQALTIREKALGVEHRHRAISLNSLAEVYRVQDRFAEAEPLYQEALAICERRLGVEHPHTATTIHSLASYFFNQGKYLEAEKFYQQALIIRRSAFGDRHPLVARSLNGLAEVYRAQGRFAEAEPLYEKAVQIYEQTFGPTHPYLAMLLENYSNLLRETKQKTKASNLRLRAEKIKIANIQTD